MRHVCNNADYDVVGVASAPYDVFFDRVSNNFLAEPDDLGAKQLLHFRYGLREALTSLLGPGEAAQFSCSDRVSSRYSVKFAGIPFAVEMPESDVYRDMRHIDTREELVDAIAEFHWCPNEHDLMYDGAAEDIKVCSACGGEGGRGLARLSCKVCDFHLCRSCRIPLLGGQHERV
jgi:hypothetical protein